MKKLNNYKGSIAEDIDYLQYGNIKPFVTAVLGCGAFAACSLIPEAAPAFVTGAAYIASGVAAVGGFGVTLYNDLVVRRKAKKRVHKLLDHMGVPKDVNEYDMEVIFDVPVEVQNVDKKETVDVNYIIVDQGNKQSVLREVTADDYRDYKQYIMDLTNPVEKQLVTQELDEDACVLRLK